jgi:glycosyltransferase involved in cell wall biosynthesis
MISIITVCYNSERTIERTIQSVLAQNCKNVEYIIVDGLSTDNTLSIINTYASKIDVIISEKDSGIYDAINKGIKNAKGDIVGILNADDVFNDDNVLSTILDTFNSNKNLESIIGDIILALNDKCG